MQDALNPIGRWIPDLTDLDNGYTLALGLAVWLTPDIQQLLADRDLPAFQWQWRLDGAHPGDFRRRNG